MHFFGNFPLPRAAYQFTCIFKYHQRYQLIVSLLQSFIFIVSSASSGRTSSSALVPSLNGYTIEPSITRPGKQKNLLKFIKLKFKQKTYSHQYIDFLCRGSWRSLATRNPSDLATLQRKFVLELSSTIVDPL